MHEAGGVKNRGALWQRPVNGSACWVPGVSLRGSWVLPCVSGVGALPGGWVSHEPLFLDASIDRSSRLASFSTGFDVGGKAEPFYMDDARQLKCLGAVFHRAPRAHSLLPMCKKNNEINISTACAALVLAANAARRVLALCCLCFVARTRERVRLRCSGCPLMSFPGTTLSGVCGHWVPPGGRGRLGICHMSW